MKIKIKKGGEKNKENNVKKTNSKKEINIKTENNTNNENSNNEENKFMRTHKEFQSSINEEFKEYKVSEPNSNSQPCFTEKNKIK